MSFRMRQEDAYRILTENKAYTQAYDDALVVADSATLQRAYTANVEWQRRDHGYMGRCWLIWQACLKRGFRPSGKTDLSKGAGRIEME